MLGHARTAELDGLDELLDRQLAVASRHQLLDLGMKGYAMQYRARRGSPWQTLLPGVCLTVSGGAQWPQKEMAALLYGGSGSLITGPAALMHYSTAADVIDVLAPTTPQRHSAGFARLPPGPRRSGKVPTLNSRPHGTQGIG